MDGYNFWGIGDVELTESQKQMVESLTKRNNTQIGGSHYTDMDIQPWDVQDTWPVEQQVGALRAYALKYLMRMDYKEDRLVQAKKALHSISKLVEVLENDR